MLVGKISSLLCTSLMLSSGIMLKKFTSDILKSAAHDRLYSFKKSVMAQQASVDPSFEKTHSMINSILILIIRSTSNVS